MSVPTEEVVQHLDFIPEPAVDPLILEADPDHLDFIPDDLAELRRAVTRMAAHINLADWRFVKLIAAMDRARGWREGGYCNLGNWLDHRCGLGPCASRERIRIGRALERLPRIDAAFRDGVISYSKVRAITRVATPHTEAMLLAIAEGSSAAQLESLVRTYERVGEWQSGLHADCQCRFDRRGWCRKCFRRNSGRSRLRGQRQGGLHAACMCRCHRHGRFRRRFRGNGRSSGLADIRAFKQGTALRRRAGGHGRALPGEPRGALEAAPHRPALRGGADHRPQRAGQAAVGGRRALPRRARLGHRRRGRPPHRLRRRPHGVRRRRAGQFAQLRAPAADRAGPAAAGIEAARPEPLPLPGLRAQRYVEAHHVQHWIDGGETRLDNLVLLCSAHHRLLHHGAYHITTEDGDVVFVGRNGEVVAPALNPQFPGVSAETPLPDPNAFDCPLPTRRRRPSVFETRSEREIIDMLHFREDWGRNSRWLERILKRTPEYPRTI